jgi:hypothetical protein
VYAFVDLDRTFVFGSVELPDIKRGSRVWSVQVLSGDESEQQ